MALNKQQIVLRQNRTMIAHANGFIAQVAAEYDVLIADLVSFKLHHSDVLTDARMRLVQMLADTVQYRDNKIGKANERRWLIAPLTPELADEGWRPISTPDMAVLVGARDHSAIVLTLQRARKLRRARRMAQEVAA